MALKGLIKVCVDSGVADEVVSAHFETIRKLRFHPRLHENDFFERDYDYRGALAFMFRKSKQLSEAANLWLDALEEDRENHIAKGEIERCRLSNKIGTYKAQDKKFKPNFILNLLIQICR